MIKAPKKTRAWAINILAESKNKNSDAYFIDKYFKPALLFGSMSMFLMYYFNYSTLTGRLEFRIFIFSMIFSSLAIYYFAKKIKKFKNDTAWGTFSDDFIKLGFVLIHTCPK